jgi:voltage-gated potassium channel
MDFRRLRISFTLLFATITFGTISYHVVEDMSLFDSFYMTLITISTVGFSEVKPLTIYGRIITISIISTGITIGAYTIGTMVRMLIEGELRKTYGRRKLEKQISTLNDHYIICGYGRIGSLICKELQNHNIDFVVIDNDVSSIERIEKEKMYYLPMDATTEEALLKAGIMNAKGIVTAVQSDADNVFITLTAKGLRPDIFILSRASNEKNEVKLKRAGATRVVSPYLIGGRRMAQVLIRPTVVDFIDIAMMDEHLGLVMEEAKIREGSDMIGKSLVESNLRRDFGFIIVAIKKNSGEMIYNPQPHERLGANDVVVVLGKKADLERMKSVL